MSKCPVHMNDLPCRMCKSESDTDGAVITRFYLKFGKVVADVKDGRIKEVRYCQSGNKKDLIGHSPSDFELSC